MQTQDKLASILAKQESFGLMFQGFKILDPAILYAIQVTNAAADAILNMDLVLGTMHSDQYCGWSEEIQDLAEDVTDIVDALIDFAAHYAKASV